MTTPAAPPAAGRQELFGTALRPEEVALLISAIVAGGQFSSTLTPYPASNASVVFPVITDVEEPEWTKELAVIPTLGLEGEPLVVSPTRLSGIVMLSREAVDDSSVNLSGQVRQILQDRWSAIVDRDFLSGTGEGSPDDPTPKGLIPEAPAAAGTSLWAATVAAKASILDAGGTATHLAMTPTAIGEEEGRVDEDGRPLWPDGFTNFAALQVVPTPAADPPLVYDRSRIYLVTRSGYEAMISQEYAAAFERYAVALRLTARMAAACPVPSMAMRKLTVTEPLSGGAAPASAQAATHAATAPQRKRTS